MWFYLRWLGLKIEAIWWMTRPIMRPPILICATGWLSARNGGYADLPRMSLMLMFIWSIASVIALVNDILDEPDDCITASYLPLPSGLVARREAILGLLFFLLAASVSLVTAVDNLQQLVSNVFLVCMALLIVILYSLFKGSGFIASALASIPLPMTACMGWISAGAGGESLHILLIVIYAFLFGFSNNLIAALQDKDKDPLTDNLTIPTRIGSKNAFMLVVALTSLNLLIIVILALTVSGGFNALPMILVSLFILLISYNPLLEAIGEVGRGRVQYIEDIRLWEIGRHFCNVSMVCVFAFIPGFVIGLGLLVLRYLFERGYKFRIIEGAISNAIQETSLKKI